MILRGLWHIVNVVFLVLLDRIISPSGIAKALISCLKGLMSSLEIQIYHLHLLRLGPSSSEPQVTSRSTGPGTSLHSGWISLGQCIQCPAPGFHHLKNISLLSR